MKIFLSFVCGAAAMLGFNALHGANPSHHVYELRVYHVNQGKTEALQARFRDHTDAIFLSTVNRRKSPSRAIMLFAFWGSSKTSDEMECRVLKRKCG
jgi:hypothetical protein